MFTINKCNKKAIIVLLVLASLCLIFAAISMSVNSSNPADNQQNVTPTPVPTIPPTTENNFVPVTEGFGVGLQGYQGNLDMPVQDLRVAQT